MNYGDSIRNCEMSLASELSNAEASVLLDCERKKRTQRKEDTSKRVDAILARWAEDNKAKGRTQKAPAKGSKKGCMKGKGGPENSICDFRGVRQRKSGKWVAEIREPNSVKKLWLGTFESAVQGALAYDKAARVMYGLSARLNFPDVQSTSDCSLLVGIPTSRGESMTTCIL